ncbi:MAG: DNA helicase [Lentisphaerae bacterium]|nr:DNA helicase [Lentisphaerota bacterium]
MSLILAQSFVKQLKRLTQKEQGVVSRTVLELQMDPTASTLSLHKVDGNAGWWSAYANGDLRIILKREENGLMILCWTDHHDKAYLWASRHFLEAHPKTGAMQIVEIPEVKGEISQNEDSTVVGLSKSICEKLGIKKDDLLEYGIPEIWVDKVWSSTNEDELLNIAQEHLPSDAAEAVLSIAVGEVPVKKPVTDANPIIETPKWETGDWWVVSEDDDLAAALKNQDWDTWCVYLHPSQRKIAYRFYDGPYRVCGGAGTGKTVVALHHVRHLLKEMSNENVLVVTFSDVLVDDLKRRLRGLLLPREFERVQVLSLVGFAKGLYERIFPKGLKVIPNDMLYCEAYSMLNQMKDCLPDGITPSFVLSEFKRVIEPRQLNNEEAYMKALRRGVHTRLAANSRRQIWKVVEKVYHGINELDEYITTNQMFAKLMNYFQSNSDASRLFSYIVVDECQDLCEIELDFLTAYLGREGRAFFAGDIGQRIIRFSFPWKSHGIDLRGRSRVLKVNYRTTHQIRTMADRLADLEQSDADGESQNRKGTVSLLSGPKPEIRKYATQEEEIKGVAEYLNHLLLDLKIPGKAVALFYRSERERFRAWAALEMSYYNEEISKPAIVKMLESKGLEYQAVVVMACDNDVIPSPERLAEADLVAGIEEIYDTERNLLYVACTRARDYLLVTSAGVPSELLLDMNN